MSSTEELSISDSESLSGSDSGSIITFPDNISLSGDYHHDSYQTDSDSDVVEPVERYTPAEPKTRSSGNQEAVSAVSKGVSKTKMRGRKTKNVKLQDAATEESKTEEAKGTAKSSNTQTRSRKTQKQNATTEGSETEEAKGAAKSSNTQPRSRKTQKQNATTEGSETEEAKGAAKSSNTQPRSRKTQKKNATTERSNTEGAKGAVKSNAKRNLKITDPLAGSMSKLASSVPPSNKLASLWGDDPIYAELIQKVGTFIVGLIVILVELSTRRREKQHS